MNPSWWASGRLTSEIDEEVTLCWGTLDELS